MKIYTRVVSDILTGEVVEEQSFDYEGEITRCGGKTPPAPQKPTPPKSAKDPSVATADAVAAQKERAKKYMGIASTIKSGFGGATIGAKTATKKLLGA